MQAGEFTTLIANLGFPIAMCIMLLYFMMKELKSHKEETELLTNVIADNTKAIEKLQTVVDTICEYFVKGEKTNNDA